MSRGPKHTPTVLKLLRGNPGQRPINLDEPQPDPLEVDCPAELVDLMARAEWTRAIVPAIGIGQITSADRTLAIAHCELWATWQSQLTEAARHPHVVATGKHKYPLPNPARVMANKTLHLLATVDEKLGFSPTSRCKVQVKGPRTLRATMEAKRTRFFGTDRG